MREHVQFSFHKYGAISFSLFGSVKNYLCPLISLINLHAWSIVPRPANIYIIQNVGAFDLFYLFNYYYYYFIFLKGGGLICLIVKDSKKWWSWNLIPYQHSDRVRTAFCSFSCQKPPHIYAEILISWKGRKTTALAHWLVPFLPCLYTLYMAILIDGQHFIVF